MVRLLPPMAALLAADPGLFRLELGYWTHEQDIRAAVGLPKCCATTHT